MVLTPRCVRRSGFTLVELLVAMAIMVTLASIALIVVPDAMEQDRTTDGAATVRNQLRLARQRAIRDSAPRGVRFFKSAANPAWSVELQHIEQPPPYLVQPLTGAANPYIEFRYGPPTGAITTRDCVLVIPQPVPAPVPALVHEVIQYLQNSLAQGLMPELFIIKLDRFKINGLTQLSQTEWRLGFPAAPSPWTQIDAAMGAGGSRRFYSFAIYLPSRPLLGEPTVLLPPNIGVDLLSSSPQPDMNEYDVLFAPDGQIIDPAEGQVLLWVRDLTKNGGNNTGSPAPYPSANFDQAGEQQIVWFKKSGGAGVVPVAWPGNPFQFALSGK